MEKNNSIIIIDSETGKECTGSKMANLVKLLEDYDINKRVVILGEAVVKLGLSAKMLSESFKILATLDISKSEKEIIIDSISDPKLLNNLPWINESASMDKKALRKLSKKLKINQNIEPQTQAEIWSNKWNKKIKRKL